MVPVCAFGQSSSPIALTPDGKTVCAVNQDSGSISLWDWAGDDRVREVSVGEEPRNLAVSPDGGRIYVTCQRSQTLVVVDGVAGKVANTMAIGGQPYGVVPSPDGRKVFVSQYAGGYIAGTYHAGALAVVDAAQHKVLKRIPVKSRPWAMAMAKDGKRLYVTHYLHIRGTGYVSVVNTETLVVEKEIPLPEDRGPVAGRGGIFNALSSIALHPSGHRALVAGMHANTRRGLIMSNEVLSHKTTVQAVVAVLDLGAGKEINGARMVSSFDGQAVAVPSAVAFLNGGAHFIDLYQASNDFKTLKYNERGIVAERALKMLPDGPSGMAVAKDGRTVFILSRWGRSVSCYDLRDVRQPKFIKTKQMTAEPWEAGLLRGAKLFHNTRDTRMTANRWLSCATCHLDSGMISDALVWDLTPYGNIPKVSNTLDLVLTPISSPAFFHRGLPEPVLALEDFVNIFQAGGGFLALPPRFRRRARVMDYTNTQRVLPPGVAIAQEWKDILRYVATLRPRPNPHRQAGQPRPEIRDSAERGRKVFFDEKAACAACHGGPAFTLSGAGRKETAFDVGLRRAIDVPSLLHLWDTAPYLHDGRAATLREVFTIHNKDDLHGRTQHLSDRELDDLVTFLLSAGEGDPKE